MAKYFAEYIGGPDQSQWWQQQQRAEKNKATQRQWQAAVREAKAMLRQSLEGYSTLPWELRPLDWSRIQWKDVTWGAVAKELADFHAQGKFDHWPAEARAMLVKHGARKGDRNNSRKIYVMVVHMVATKLMADARQASIKVVHAA